MKLKTSRYPNTQKLILKEKASEYDKQASKFLKDTKATIEADFLKHDKYFDSDTESRNIYQITIKRGGQIYSFRFGQSINNSQIRVVNTNNNRTWKVINYPNYKDYINSKNELDIDRFCKNNSFHFIEADKISFPKTPSNYDILASIEKYNPYTFQNFCENCGYDTDSRSAEKIYHGVIDQWLHISGMFNESEIEKLCEIC